MMVPKKIALWGFAVGWLVLILACGGGGGDVEDVGEALTAPDTPAESPEQPVSAQPPRTEPREVPRPPSAPAHAERTASAKNPDRVAQPAKKFTPAAPHLNPRIVALLDEAFRLGEREKQNAIDRIRTEAKRQRQRNVIGRAKALDEKADGLETALHLSLPKLYAPFHVGQLGYVLEPFEVISIVDERNIIAMGFFNNEPQTVWIRGNTDGIASDDTFTVNEETVYHVSGTKDYVTALGTRNRVLLLEPVDLDPYLKKYRAELAARAKPEPLKQPESASADESKAKNEKAAAAKLRLAEQFFELDKIDKGKRWLREVIEDYPGTKAAAAAEGKLRAMR
jgi:hypothetical protein